MTMNRHKHSLQRKITMTRSDWSESAVSPVRGPRAIVRQWWLRYQLECSEGELAGIERDRCALDEERRVALRRNLVLRSALKDSTSPCGD